MQYNRGNHWPEMGRDGCCADGRRHCLTTRREKRRKKTRTQEHILAELSVNYVERQVLLRGWSVDRVQHDYGVDLSMSTYSEAGEIENGRVLLQVKATRHL